MNRGLWLLLGLQVNGWVRYLGRSLRTLRGALLALVGLGVLVPYLIILVTGPAVGGGIDPDGMRRYGPVSLVVCCLLNVIFSSHERAIYFTPAEVQFLFTGPFGRRQLLLYKLLLTILVTLPATLFMSAALRLRHGWLPAVLVGWVLISIFMQLFSIALGLLASAAGEQLFSRGRKLTLALAVLIAGLIVFQARGTDASWDYRVLGEQLFETRTWQVVSWPVRSFFDVMLATRLWPDLVVPLLVALSVLLALVVLIFALDAHYEETAAATSARVYAKIQRLRGRAVNVEGPAKAARPPRWEVPALPYWGGVGPILWRQLTAALRGLGRVLWVLFVLGVGLAFPVLGSGFSESDALLPALAGLVAWLSIFLTALVPFDFRGDIDRIATLKTLPIVPWRLALGQLLVPTLFLTLMQWVTLAVAAALAPAQALLVLALAVYVPVFSFVIVGLENLLFLLFPVRIMAATPGDFQALGRNVLLAIGKLMGIAVVGSMGFLAGMIAFLVTGRLWVGLLAGWPPVAFTGALLVPLVSLAFQWFDVGRDTPA